MTKTIDKVGIFNEEEARKKMKSRGGEDELMPTEQMLPPKEKANVGLVDEVREQSIQPRADDELTRTAGGRAAGRRDVADIVNRELSFFFQSGDVLPPWWSPARDRALSDFWKAVSVLSGAMYAMASKMATIPWHIEPKDKALTSHFVEAKRFERNLRESAEFGSGWGAFMQKQMISLLGQDNGRFMEIIDLSPDKKMPLRPPALSVAHLDPSRCTRTSDLEFPVKYLGIDGKQRVLHWTRVAFESQLPSMFVRMYGVGTCAVSRAASYGQNMLDMANYKGEKLGSRPLRGILIAKGGLDAKAVGVALTVAYEAADNAGLSRFSRLPIIGNPDIEDAEIDLVSLSSLPDGFDEETWTTIAMSAIALAFGVDARELWPMQSRGSTKADAVLSHIKQRGKAPGHIIAETERMFNNWFLPRHLAMVFDFQDDAQDRQKAEISRERALARKTNLELSVTDVREERQTMVTNGTLTGAQFKDLELGDGRLPDGKPLDTLYFRDEPVYQEILSLSGIPNPTDIRSNDTQKVLDEISKQRSVALEMLSQFQGEIKKRQATESLAALDFLAQEYRAFESEAMVQEQQELQMSESRDDPEAGQRETSLGAPAETDDERTVTTPSQAEGTARESEEAKSMKIFDRFKKQQDPRQLVMDAFKEMFKPPDVFVEVTPEITIQAAPTPDVIVNVPEQKVPEITVEAPEVKIPDIIIPETKEAKITVNVPKQEPPNVVVNIPEKDTGDFETVEIERNERGEISTLKRKKIKGDTNDRRTTESD